ncbi:hypothetical protein H4Q26_014419 [Puccinia striiformis f. sp. tritici PST-130]|uniref:Uncharacterized protein n=1 Tax=Puccinia striiformis f. sp. tritici PST-78 TaxID=1165861 RepID=A0A0L0VJQ3_9BASI|nr:hypothetical protein H4Q26_014419 [Puccinia striiformis f. sp. tritici PST-130]KNE99493.1 hypothetical protein PSTG_07210 [Puccinia striiformis f. sp. tritici PST-78]
MESVTVVVEGYKHIIEDITDRNKLKQSFAHEYTIKGLFSPSGSRVTSSTMQGLSGGQRDTVVLASAAWQ